MLEQVRNVVVIKISVVISYICSFVYTGVKIIFTCIKIVVHPRSMLHCGIISVYSYDLDFRHENNSTLGVNY